MKQQIKHIIYREDERLITRRSFSLIDAAGMAVSGLCLIHCLMMPLILVILPTVSAAESITHPLLAIAALVFSVFVFLKEKKHGMKNIPAVFFIAGNILIISASFYLHEILPESEIIIMGVGSLFLISAHYLNILKCSKNCRIINH